MTPKTRRSAQRVTRDPVVSILEGRKRTPRLARPPTRQEIVQMLVLPYLLTVELRKAATSADTSAATRTV